MLGEEYRGCSSCTFLCSTSLEVVEVYHVRVCGGGLAGGWLGGRWGDGLVAWRYLLRLDGFSMVLVYDLSGVLSGLSRLLLCLRRLLWLTGGLLFCELLGTVLVVLHIVEVVWRVCLLEELRVCDELGTLLDLLVLGRLSGLLLVQGLLFCVVLDAARDPAFIFLME